MYCRGWTSRLTREELQNDRLKRRNPSPQRRSLWIEEVVDGLAYLRIGGLPSNETIEKFGRGRYSKVFLLDRLPFYENDSERKESLDVQEKIHDEIKKHTKTSDIL